MSRLIELNEKLQDLFTRMKPLHEEFKQLVLEYKDDWNITLETNTIMSESAKSFLEADSILWEVGANQFPIVDKDE